MSDKVDSNTNAFNPSRRDFLKSTTVASAGFMLDPNKELFNSEYSRVFTNDPLSLEKGVERRKWDGMSLEITMQMENPDDLTSKLKDFLINEFPDRDKNDIKPHIVWVAEQSRVSRDGSISPESETANILMDTSKNYVAISENGSDLKIFDVNEIVGEINGEVTVLKGGVLLYTHINEKEDIRDVYHYQFGEYVKVFTDKKERTSEGNSRGINGYTRETSNKPKQFNPTYVITSDNHLGILREEKDAHIFELFDWNKSIKYTIDNLNTALTTMNENIPIFTLGPDMIGHIGDINVIQEDPAERRIEFRVTSNAKGSYGILLEARPDKLADLINRGYQLETIVTRVTENGIGNFDIGYLVLGGKGEHFMVANVQVMKNGRVVVGQNLWLADRINSGTFEAPVQNELTPKEI